MDYLLWLFLLFLGMFVKCLGAALAFFAFLYIFNKYFDNSKPKEAKGDI